MNRLFTTAAALALLLFHGPSGIAYGSIVIDRVVAIVDDEVITMSDLQHEAAKSGVQNQDQRVLLEEMINRKLQLAAAKRSGLDVTDKEVDDAIEEIKRRNNKTTKELEAELAKEGMTIEQYRLDLKEQMTLSRVFNKYVRSGIALDEAEIRAYYDRNQKEFTLPEEIRLRQIVLRIPVGASPSQAAAIKERARIAAERALGGEDFISLVREFSDPDAARDNGDLGFMQWDHIHPDLARAAQSLRPGRIAGPIQTKIGYHIIKLEEARTPVKPFEQVKDEITNFIYKQKIENSYRSWLQGLRKESLIENRL